MHYGLAVDHIAYARRVREPISLEEFDYFCNRVVGAGHQEAAGGMLFKNFFYLATTARGTTALRWLNHLIQRVSGEIMLNGTSGFGQKRTTLQSILRATRAQASAV